MRNIPIFCLLGIFFLMTNSCKKNTVNKEIFVIDSLRINNITIDSEIARKSSITYFFCTDIKIKGKDSYLFYNKHFYKFRETNETNEISKKHCYSLEFNDFLVGVENLNDILKTYNSIIFFKKAKLVIDRNKFIYLSTDEFTKRTLLLNNKMVKLNDSININKGTSIIRMQHAPR